MVDMWTAGTQVDNLYLSGKMDESLHRTTNLKSGSSLEQPESTQVGRWYTGGHVVHRWTDGIQVVHRWTGSTRLDRWACSTQVDR